MKRLLLTVLIVTCKLAGADEVSGAAERGAGLYYEFACFSCHGYNATGYTPLSGKTSGIMGSESLFLTYLRLRADQNPINPSRAMPNYSETTLSDEQALDIYAYIVSLEDDPPEVSDIPAFVEILESADTEDEH